MGIAEALEDLLEVGKVKGIDYVARQMCKASAGNPLESRRRTALFVMGLRLHAFTPDDFQERHDGLFGQCRHCGMVVKVPSNESLGVIGRATEFLCPSAPQPVKDP